MSTTTKSPRKLAAEANRIARDTLPENKSRYSPKKFTQPQLMVCSVLKTFFSTDYRGIVQILDDCPRRFIKLPSGDWISEASALLAGEWLNALPYFEDQDWYFVGGLEFE